MVSDFIDKFLFRLSLWLGGRSWKDAKTRVDELERWTRKNSSDYKTVMMYMKMLNRVPGLKVWIVKGYPLQTDLITSCYLKVTLESRDQLDHKERYFVSLENLISYMKSGMGGMTLSAGDRSFSFPTFGSSRELKMKLELMGLV